MVLVVATDFMLVNTHATITDHIKVSLTPVDKLEV